MKKFKVYLRSGTVVPMVADEGLSNNNGYLSFYRDGKVIGHFAPNMWEGFQDLVPLEPRKTEESGS